MTFRSCWLSGLGLGVRPGIAQSTVNICAGFLTATPHNSRLTAQAPLRRLRHDICVAKMLDKTSSIICAFGLAAAAPRSPYRHLELCGITLCKRPAYFPACKT